MRIFNLNKHTEYILKCLIRNITHYDSQCVNFFSYNNRKPYIIGISGSVASGKSTMSHWLQIVLKNYFVKKRVSVVTTDNFLYPNKILHFLGLMQNKGFPKTYDVKSLVNFFLDIKFGISNKIVIPVYSHLQNDIVFNRSAIVKNSDIFIIEGLHIFNPDFYKQKNVNFFVSNFFNFSMYIDVDNLLLEDWYLNRFLKLKYISKFFTNSFFNIYSKISDKTVKNIAIKIWYDVNFKNLEKNIILSKKYTNFVIKKNFDHSISSVSLRRQDNIKRY
ncbi:type I pantothenate kinase [Buchnera aphidicola]|uniref:type I pantothenate kinase n=1 Tax=Buchnera aphidicola TaxID=9 RepID=UPI0012AC3C4B|nr:type I pantothenate kinase [Buchnera aphidicola]